MTLPGSGCACPVTLLSGKWTQSGNQHGCRESYGNVIDVMGTSLHVGTMHLPGSAMTAVNTSVERVRKTYTGNCQCM